MRQKFSEIIFYLEWLLTFFHLTVAIGTYLNINNFVPIITDPISKVMSIPFLTGSAIFIIAYFGLLLLIPIASLFYFRKKFIKTNITLLITTFIHILLFFSILSGIKYL